jgi:hypothetical protein
LDIGITAARTPSLMLIAECFRISILDLTSIRTLRDQHLTAIAQALCDTLEILNVSQCTRITQVSLHAIAQCSKLRKLVLSNCVAVSRPTASLAALSSMAELALSGLRCEDDDILMFQQSMPLLIRLDLSKNHTLTSTSVNYLAQMPSLRHVNLRQCSRISPDALSWLSAAVPVVKFTKAFEQ